MVASREERAKTLEMRIAELEDKVRQTHITDEDVAAYNKVVRAMGGVPLAADARLSAGTGAAAEAAGARTTCVVSTCVISPCVTSQCVLSPCFVGRCVMRCIVGCRLRADAAATDENPSGGFDTVGR